MSRARLGDRSLFPDLEARAYLSHAAIGPTPAPVVQAVHASLDAFARRGMGAFGPATEQREQARASLARLIGAQPDDVALTSGTSAGIAAVAHSLDWRPGQRILCFEGEFPANVTGWQQAAPTYGVDVVLGRVSDFRGDAEVGLAWLDAALAASDVRLVAVSAAQFQTGLTMPLSAIIARAHAHGAEVFVDAIQAVGAMSFDVTALGADYVAGGAHKWLMGVEGAGWLYVAPHRAEALVPRLAGWLSHQDALSFLFDGPGLLRYDRPIEPRARFLERGTSSSLGFAALGAAVDLLLGLGVDTVAAHIGGLHDLYEPALVARGFTSLREADPAARSGVLALQMPDGVSAPALSAALNARGIVVTTPEGLLRVAPSWPNSAAEVPLVMDAVDAALAEVRAG